MRMSDWSSDVCSSDLHLQVGSRVAVHCTAIGKLLVAEQHKNVRTRILKAKPLKRYTENTLTDPAALEAEFAAIRSNGYSFNNEELERGLTGIAVPIRDKRKRVVAGLSINAPLPRMSREKAMSYVPVMQAKADQIAKIWSLTGRSEEHTSELK